MKKYSIGLLLLCVLSSCNQDAKQAQEGLDRARAYYERNEFFSARNEIDSVRAKYPKELGAMKEALTLMRQIDLREAERNIAFCDSLMPIRLHEADSLKAGFTFEKDSAYEEIGHYIWKQQTIERNVQRCYVRCGVDENGEMYVASVYYGGRPTIPPSSSARPTECLPRRRLSRMTAG